MRVIAGSARGTRLHAPPGRTVRPTTDRARETLFNVLGDAVEGARCLDLFAGSGALGIEALSRGAEHCTFVDRHPGALQALRDNLARTHLGRRATVLGATWQSAIGRLQRHGQAFDLVFLDPPWDTDLGARCLRRLLKAPELVGSALVVVEHRSGEDEEAFPGWSVLRLLQVGECGFALCRVQPEDVP